MSKKKSAWDIVTIARSNTRKTSLDYIDNIFDDFLEFHGDRLSFDDGATVCGVGFLNNKPVTIIAQQKGRTTKENIERNFGMPNPESYRKVVRFVKQSEKFNRPIITFIDTKGAYPGIKAEENGQGWAISKSIFEFAKVRVPVIAVIIGEGSSGGALALGVGNKVLMLEHAIYSILSPEGFASILYKDTSKKEEVSEKMKLTSYDLLSLKIIDKIIKEHDDESDNSFVKTVLELKQDLILELDSLSKKSKDELVKERYDKFRYIDGLKEKK